MNSGAPNAKSGLAPKDNSNAAIEGHRTFLGSSEVLPSVAKVHLVHGTIQYTLPVERVPAPDLSPHPLYVAFDEFCLEFDESGDCRHTLELSNGSFEVFVTSQMADFGSIVKSLWKAVVTAGQAGADSVVHRIFWSSDNESQTPLFELGLRIKPERPIDFLYILCNTKEGREIWWIVDKTPRQT